MDPLVHGRAVGEELSRQLLALDLLAKLLPEVRGLPQSPVPAVAVFFLFFQSVSFLLETLGWAVAVVVAAVAVIVAVTVLLGLSEAGPRGGRGRARQRGDWR